MMIEMQSDKRRTGRSTLLVAAMLLAGVMGSFLLSACGGDEKNKCRDVTCGYGVCNPKTGECVNADTCDPNAGQSDMADAGQSMMGDAGQASMPGVTESDCLQGYVCNAGTCEAEFACQSDAECQGNGICQDGACINKKECESDDACVDGYRCGDNGKCVVNPCADKNCPRGVCEVETGKCVNREVCPSPDDEEPACIEDYKCYGQSCVDEEQFCEDLDCQRGVCSFEELKCVDAETCESDQDCLDGDFCNTEEGTCQVNQCNAQMTDCPRGTCDRASGECVNPETCSAPEDCLAMNYCLGDSCVPEDEACGQEGCPGNQVCDYNEQQLSASCVVNPNEDCRNAIDCTGDQICRPDGTCSAVQGDDMCADDSHEPNNSASEATDYHGASQGAPVAGSLCSGDTDFFKFDTANESAIRGRFTVDLFYEELDVGLGTLEVELIDPDGNTVVTKQAGATTPGEIHIDQKFQAGTSGVFTIAVRGTGDVNAAGVDYELLADIVDQSVITACMSPDTLMMPKTTGNSLNGGTVALDASCIAEGPKAAENIYSFQLNEASYVDLTVAPTGSGDISVSVRSKCESLQAETHCKNSTGQGGDETISDTFEPGTYYVIVQGPGQQTGGDYEITFESSKVVCTDADNRCVDSSNAKICNSKGTKLEDVSCDNGCNMQRGVCNRPAGDACWTTVDATSGITDGSITWGDLQDDLDPGAGSCLGMSQGASDGPDKIYEVELKPNWAMKAELSLSGSQDGSLYLLSQCSQASSNCKQGTDADSDPESLSYKNDTMQTETVYLVADSASGTTGQATINIEAGEVTCTPGNSKCMGSAIQVCNDIGTGFATTKTCSNGCSMGACRGDTCATAIDAGTGGNFSMNTSNLSKTYGLTTSDCVGEDLTEQDAVFKVSVPAGQWMKAEVTPQGNSDPALYIVEDCSSTMTHQNTCVAGTNENDSGGDTLYHQNDTMNQKAYFLVVDSDGIPSFSGATWDLDIQTLQPQCTPGDTRCATNNPAVLEYCGERGLQYQSYRCPGLAGKCLSSGSSAKCNTASGEACFSAIPVKDGDTKTGTLDDPAGNNIEMPEGQTGQCYFGDFDETDGYETIYSINLNKGQVLETKLSTADDSARMYVLSNCSDKKTCLANTDDDGPGKLHFKAPSAGEYFVVVDSTSSFGSDSFTVEFNVLSGATCTPGQLSCVGSNQAAVCDAFGQGYTSQTNCANGCQNGACTIQQSAVDTCAMAPDIGKGIIVRDTFNGLTNNVDLPSGSCTPTAGDGPDSIYKVTMSAGEVLTARAESLGSDEVVLYAIKSCSMPDQSCQVGNAAGANGESTSITYKASGQETLYVVVDSNTSSSDEPFEAEISVQPQQCTQGQTKCGPQGKNLQYCNSNGLWENYACNTGCQSSGSGARCANPTGDVCLDAVPVSGGQSIQGNFGGTDTFQLGGDRVGACFIDNTDSLDGGDTFYTIGLGAGETLSAKLSTSESDAQLLILEQCGNADSCVANNPAGGATTETYRASSAQRVWIVVDSMGSSNASYTLDVDVSTSRACAPGETVCTGSGAVGVCTSDGRSYTGQYNCAQGCNAGACAGDPNADKCSSAPTIQGGTVVYHNYDTGTDDVSISSSASCTGSSGPANDRVYKINLMKDQLLRVTAQSWGGESPLVYIVDDCTQPDSTCRAAGEPSSGFAETTFKAPSAGTYYVVLDGTYGTMDEPVEMRVETLPKECTSGQTKCSPNGQDLLVCDDNGRFDSFACDGGCTTASGSPACKNPTGDICLDRIQAQVGNTYTGTFSGKADDFNPSDTSCGILSGADSYDGSDVIYEVPLQQGQVLSADLKTSQNDAGMYILGSCPSGTINSCLAGDNESSNLEFYASQSKSYFLVLDSESTSGNSYTLTLSASSGSCQPDKATCSSGTLNICKSDGSGAGRSISCANGCTGQFCDGPAMGVGETCMNPHVISSGETRMLDKWDPYSDDLDIGAQQNGCGITDSDGKDAVYAVDVPDGEYLKARVEPQGDVDDPTLYLMTDCSMPSSCVAGDQVQDIPAETGWYNDTGSSQRIFIVADTEGSSDDDEFVLDVTTQPSACTPNPMNPPARCVDANTAEVCNSYGAYETQNCYFGCDTNTGQCKPAPNDTCQGAITLQSGQTYKGPSSEYADDYDADSGMGTNCVGDATPGPDAIYKANLSKGDILDVTFQSPGDAAVWLTKGTSGDCMNAADQCVAGADGSISDPEQITHTAQSAGTYYIITDVDDSGTVNGEFKLTVNRLGPPQCDPTQFSPRCTNNGKLEYCEEPGFPAQYDCASGCNNSNCTNPNGEICPVAIDASSGGTFTADMSTLSNDYDMSSNGCANDTTPGSDVAYKVNLKPGDILEASVTPKDSGDDPILYLLDNCSSNTSTLEKNCLVGKHDNFAGGGESFTYRNSTGQPQTYYVIADADEADEDNGVFETTINVKSQVCMPGTTTCKDSVTMQFCGPQGLKQYDYTCMGSGSTTCSSGACQQPTGNVCADAISVPSGGMMDTTDLSLQVNWIQMPSGTCAPDRTEGNDTIYEVQANAGQTIDVTVTPQGSSIDPVIVIMRDCQSAAAGDPASCVDGKDDNFTGGNETLSHTVQQGNGGTFYVIVDTDDDGSQTNGKADVNITVQ